MNDSDLVEEFVDITSDEDSKPIAVNTASSSITPLTKAANGATAEAKPTTAATTTTNLTTSSNSSSSSSSSSSNNTGSSTPTSSAEQIDQKVKPPQKNCLIIVIEVLMFHFHCNICIDFDYSLLLDTHDLSASRCRRIGNSSSSEVVFFFYHPFFYDL